MTCFNMSRQVKEHIGDMHVASERAFKERFNRAIEAGELPRGRSVFGYVAIAPCWKWQVRPS